MKKVKSTKKALLASMASVTLCAAMLAGSTFAWFTDSVSTGINEIVAGNLDVELSHSNGNVTDEAVTDSTLVFVNKDGSKIKWEPGVMAYENFTIKNIGSLALKYRLGFNIGEFNTVVGTEKSLKDVLKVAIVKGGFNGDRAAAKALTFDKTLADFAEGNLAADEIGKAGETCALVLYWEPSAVDNDYNLSNGKTSSDGDPLFIDLGVNLFATQDTVEYDSFGNDYDADAPTDSYKVTPENIQEYLDGAHGSMSNARLVLAPGNYGKLVIGTPSKYATGDTVYTCKTGSDHSNTPLTFTDAQEFTEHMSANWHYTPYYTRTISNLTLVGQEGVTIDGLLISSGHAYGENAYDPVRDKTVNGSCYYMTLDISDLAFEGINFTSKVNIATSDAETVIDGVSFEGCSFTTNGTEDSSGQGLRYYNENNNGKVRNLTVKDCSFSNCFQGIYTGSIVGISVTGCTFDTTGHNAIAIQSASAVNHKAVVIENNSFNNIGDRIIRFGLVDADTQITIKDNTATNSGDGDGEIMKAVSLAAGISYDIRNNSWGEGKTAANDELKDAE